LNFYLQPENKKTVNIIRTRDLRTLSLIPSVEVARLNSSAMFSGDAFYHSNLVYHVYFINDTSGKQFYLNRYELKSDSENFEYQLKWQFPFERKNIGSAHLFHADHKFVLLFVTVEKGNNQGAWLLKIHALTGKLIKATKIHGGTDNSRYLFGGFLIDNTEKGVLIAGQKIPAPAPNNAAVPSNEVVLYTVEIDSTGEKKAKKEFRIPVTSQKQANKKEKQFLLRIDAITKNSPDLFIETDLLKAGPDNCYRYCNTMVYHLSKTDEGYKMEKAGAEASQLVEDYYNRYDKLDMNGKICGDHASDISYFLRTREPLPVKLLFRQDENLNPYWVVTKSEVHKGTVNFSLIAPENKIYKVKKLEELPKSSDPQFTAIGKNAFAISHQQDAATFVLKRYTW
jgi:PAS domain-containing protein